MMALLMPVLLGMVGAGVDYGRYINLSMELQDIADRAAIAGAREYVLRASESTPAAVAQANVNSLLAQKSRWKTAQSSVSGIPGDRTITIEITTSYQPTFLLAIYKSPLHVTVQSMAEAVGATKVCVLALNESVDNAIGMYGSSSLQGNDCGVYSNSTHQAAMTVVGSARLESSQNCTSGGYVGGPSNFTPSPIIDCPQFTDPLGDRLAPDTSGPCVTSTYLYNQTATLYPGIYCDDLVIDGNSVVKFSPGIYVFDDSELVINGTSEVSGEHVGFFFQGDRGRVFANYDTSLSFSAPAQGSMAGILIMQDPNSYPTNKYVISSNDAAKLEGTIYLPNGQLFIDATRPVADASAYTAIVVDKLELQSSASLVLNSDYAATDVPVPEGLAGAANVVLRD